MSNKKAKPKVVVTGRVVAPVRRVSETVAERIAKERVTFRVDEEILDVLVASRDTAGIHGALALYARVLTEASARTDSLLSGYDWCFLGEALKWWGKTIRPETVNPRDYVLRECDEAMKADGLAAKVWHKDPTGNYKLMRGTLAQFDALECLAVLLSVSYFHKYCPVVGEDEKWWTVAHRLASGDRARREGKHASNK